MPLICLVPADSVASETSQLALNLSKQWNFIQLPRFQAKAASLAPRGISSELQMEVRETTAIGKANKCNIEDDEALAEVRKYPCLYPMFSFFPM